MSENIVKVGVGVLVLKDGRILLGLRNSDAEKASSELHGEGTWTMPGGKLHYGETLTQLCVREVSEETGISINSSDLRLISVQENIIPDKHFITFGFLCEKFEGLPEVMEPEEIVEWKWFPLNNFPKNIFPPSAKVLEHYLANTIF